MENSRARIYQHVSEGGGGRGGGDGITAGTICDERGVFLRINMTAGRCRTSRSSERKNPPTHTFLKRKEFFNIVLAVKWENGVGKNSATHTNRRGGKSNLRYEFWYKAQGIQGCEI